MKQIFDYPELHHPHGRTEPEYIMTLPHWQHVQIETEKGWELEANEIVDYFKGVNINDKPPMGHYYVHRNKEDTGYFISYHPDKLIEVLQNITYLPDDLMNKLNWCEENKKWFSLPVKFSMNAIPCGGLVYYGKLLWDRNECRWYFYAERLYEHYTDFKPDLKSV